MSTESAKAFFELVKSDETLAKQLHEAKSEEEVRAIIAATGDFDFTQAQWTEVVLIETGVELSDEDLEKVAGGGGYLSVNVNTSYPPIFGYIGHSGSLET